MQTVLTILLALTTLVTAGILISDVWLNWLPAGIMLKIIITYGLVIVAGGVLLIIAKLRHDEGASRRGEKPWIL